MKRSTKSNKTTVPSAKATPKRVGSTPAKSAGTKAANAAAMLDGATAGGPATSTAELDQKLLELLALRVEATRTQLQAATAESGATPPLWQLHETALQQTAGAVTALGLNPARVSEWIKHVVSFSYEETHVTEPIAYLGPIYSYSYLAAAKHFGMAAPLVPVATIAAVFDELIRGQATYGVVPIENSTDGRVVDTLGMFARLPVKICGEVLLPVHHCLLGRCPRGEIV